MRRRRWAVLAAVALFAGGFAYARYFWGPGPEALERQRGEVQRLSGELTRRLRERARLRDGSGESVLVGVPAGVAERLAGDAVAGLASAIRLTLRDLRIQKADEVQARLLVGRRSVGRYLLNVQIHEVHAQLRPGRPRLGFESERVAVTLPVAVEDGGGHARLRFKWDGRGMAGAVCGDVDVTREITASLPRLTVTLRGALSLTLEGTALVAQPEFGDVELRLPVEPSADAWRFVDELVARRGALCRAALARVDVPEKIRAALARGVKVTLPRRVLERPLRLPISVAQSLPLAGRTLLVDARPLDLVLTPSRVWYGVAVELRKADEPPPAAPPSD